MVPALPAGHWPKKARGGYGLKQVAVAPCEPGRTASRAASTFILATVLLDAVAFGVVLPLLPMLIEQLSGAGVAHAALVYGVFATAWAVAQFIAAPVLGALSDRFGRRPVVLLSCLGLGLDYVLMALAPSLLWVFVGRVLSGVLSANYATASAYVADVTPPELRAQAFGRLGAALGLGLVLGPALGGVLGSIELRLPFWIAAALSLANAAYGWWALPESLPAAQRKPFAWGRAHPLAALKLLRSHPELSGLSVVALLVNLAHVSLPSVGVLYMAYRFDWGEAEIGLTLAALGVCMGVVQAGLVQPVVARLGERGAMMLGLGCGVLAFVLVGWAPHVVVFLAAIPVVALWGVAEPAVVSLMTRRVGVSEQGLLQGAQASLEGVAGMVGPGLFSAVFAVAVAGGAGSVWAGLPFVLAAMLVLAGAGVAWRATGR